MLKKWITAAVVSAAICLAVTLWIVPQVRQARAAALQPESAASSRQTERLASAVGSISGGEGISSAVTLGYLIREYDGCVAVFRRGQQTPLQVLETPLSVLPEEDRQLLQKGITVETEAELAAVLEDYS